MNHSREYIYAALFAKFGALPGVVTTSRHLRHWTDVSPAEQPAVFQVQKRERAERVTRQPTRWFLELDIYVYAHTQDNATSPATALNPILDAIEEALEPTGGQEVQTLGGLVEYCRISGAIETDEGVLGDQAVAIIPIEILAT